MTNTNASESALALGLEGSPLDVKAEIELLNKQFNEDFQYEEEGRRRTYRRVAAMLKFVEQVHNNPLHAEAWDHERSLRQISIPEKDANPYLQYVRALDGRFRPDLDKVEFDGQSVTKWEPNRSSEKFAKTIRHCIEKGVKSDVAAEYIENYVRPDHEEEKRLFGIEQQDKHDHPAPKRVSKLKEAEQEIVRKSEGLLQLPDSIADHVKFYGDFAAVILRRHEGRIVILDDAGFSADQITNAVKRRKDTIKAVKTMEVVVTPNMQKAHQARAAEKAATPAAN
ncbi:hypothetical protein [Methylobacterium sp. SD21]|uniref:hypothetical protein n=1 Tax=Methylobacterium litchii TaxID=3138810 RepID=UPI00313EF412